MAVLAMCLAVSGARGQDREDNLRLEVARQWAGKGEYDKAVQELRVYLSEHPDSTRIYARIGGLRMKQGDFRMAAENYKVALAGNPDMTEAREGLAAAYEKAGNKQKAAEIRAGLAKTGKSAQPQTAGETDYAPAMDSIASPEPQGIYARKEFLESMRLFREKKADSLTAALRSTLSKVPGHPGAYYLGGVMRFERGEMGKALFNFKRSLDYPGRGHNAHFYMGLIHQRQGRAREAIAAFEKYLELTKSEAGRKQAQGHLARLRGGSAANQTAKAAAPSVDKVPKVEEPPSSDNPPAADRKSDPAVPEAAPKAEVLGRDGSFFFILADPASASGRKLIEAHEACRQEKFEKAAKLLKETVLEYGGSANAEAAILDLASVYLKLGLWESARDRMADYLGASPRDSVRYWDAAHYLSAVAHLGLGNGEKAEKDLLALDPDSPQGPTREEVEYRLARAGELMKDVKKWSAYLERAHASAKPPERKASLAQRLGMLYAKYGDTDKAMGYYRKSMAGCKDSSLAALCAESGLRLADLAFRKKDWKTAMAQYRQFAAQYPGHGESAWIHYQIANIQKAIHNFESALNGYKSVIDNYPDSYWASQAKWKREDAIWQKEFEEVLD